VTDRPAASDFAVSLRFHGDLSFFLKRNSSGGHVFRTLREKTSIKDVIEACGVPHPEVDLIVCDGTACAFEFHLATAARVEVYPVSASFDIRPAHRLQRRYLTRFVVDGHLGKLARDLRLLGFDACYRSDADDASLIRVSVEEDRALLTRDRRLLMHAVIRDGYCPRSDLVEDQMVEVIRRFDLLNALRPYTRCLRCNGLLERVDKAIIERELEPLTKIYFEDFRRCVECAHVYWSGSHFAKLQARIETIRVRVGYEAPK
jgi:hypothetical protein